MPPQLPDFPGKEAFECVRVRVAEDKLDRERMASGGLLYSQKVEGAEIVICRKETGGCVWVSQSYPVSTCKSQGACLVRLGHSACPRVSGQRLGCVMLGCSTHQNVKEPDMGTDSVGDLWAHLSGTVALAGLHRELGLVTS